MNANSKCMLVEFTAMDRDFLLAILEAYKHADVKLPPHFAMEIHEMVKMTRDHIPNLEAKLNAPLVFEEGDLVTAMELTCRTIFGESLSTAKDHMDISDAAVAELKERVDKYLNPIAIQNER